MRRLIRAIPPRFILTEGPEFYDQSLTAPIGSVPDMVTVARVEQKSRVESGIGMIAAGLTDGDNYLAENSLKIEPGAFDRHMSSNHLCRELGNPLWQFVSFFDGSDRGKAFSETMKHGLVGDSNAVVITAKFNRKRLGVKYPGEALVQSGITESELLEVYSLSKFRKMKVIKSLTDFTPAVSAMRCTSHVN